LSDEWSVDATPTEPVQRAIEDLLRHTIGVPADVPVTHRWAGCAAFALTDDRLPVCEPVGDDTIAVGAYSGTGNVLGPLYGRAAVRLALGRPLDELEPLVH
jgi:glycine/D-amino acid oxidase-like deaminating enzyme